jgi:type II secretory ATPase GspE/PulE/Tfp pilus assembly ATPase PilB-like protein
VPDDEAMEMISDHVSTKKLRIKALEKGMVPLYADGIEKVKAGIVSIEEILRTAATDTQSIIGEA